MHPPNQFFKCQAAPRGWAFKKIKNCDPARLNISEKFFSQFHWTWKTDQSIAEQPKSSYFKTVYSLSFKKITAGIWHLWIKWIPKGFLPWENATDKNHLSRSSRQGFLNKQINLVGFWSAFELLQAFCKRIGAAALCHIKAPESWKGGRYPVAPILPIWQMTFLKLCSRYLPRCLY